MKSSAQKIRNRMQVMIVALVLSIVGVMVSRFTYNYIVDIAKQDFVSDTAVVKETLSTVTERLVTTTRGLQRFITLLPELNPKNFSQVTDDVVSNYPFVFSITYYAKVDQSERRDYEIRISDLYDDNQGFVATSSDDSSEIVSAETSDEYLVTYLSDSMHRDSVYFGWDLLSDKSQRPIVENVLQNQKAEVSNPFLMENGDTAVDVYLPILKPSSPPQIRGILGITVLIPQLLGSDDLRKNFTTTVHVPLWGQAEKQNIFRSLDRSPEGIRQVDMAVSDVEVPIFDHGVLFHFEKDIYFSNLNYSLLILVVLGSILFVVLGIYLTITNQRLKHSLLKIEAINEGLEQTVQERTKDLKAAHLEIEEMLDNLDGAVLVIQDDHTIANRYSKASESILNIDKLGGKSIFETLFKDMTKENEGHSKHLFTLENIIGADSFQFTISQYDLKSEISFKKVVDGVEQERIFNIRYAPLLDDQGTIRRMLLVVTDVTDLLNLQRDLEQQQKAAGARTEAIQEMLSAPRQVLDSFMVESEQRSLEILAISPDDSSYQDRNKWIPIFRELHTMKGGARFAKLNVISGHIHQIESDHEALNDPQTTIDKPAVERFCQDFEEFHKVFLVYLNLYREIFSSQDQSNQSLNSVLRWLRSGREPESVADALEAMQAGEFFSFDELYASFGSMVDDVAGALSKSVTLNQEPQFLFLHQSLEAPLRDCMTHAIRNALDHGLETFEERALTNKRGMGQLWHSYESSDSSITLKLHDDGRGINTKKVLSLAQEKGLVDSDANLNDSEILELLFHSGFSTKQEATDISGRGVGLDAVRASLEKFHCQVYLESSPGKGSATCIKIPMNLVYNKNHLPLQKIS
ncbi:CHASE domain-containing protein [Pseudobacteriovorax antillogorgiicola]|uniref:histidine kinase n=1 Tax=Pseudobacteriovorax antillogorgiicola TaxID=1513793 RepID=A0A1Y6CS41_9BACT|nr:ATP-binding protein [Pseudobacteriovorax antillogorgiicola]TCS45620.1 Hpt domain-containing protein [Pseudobacteriovorax antillogorgiicola]SMF72431.1 Hpt domain-containing protein [Pseudobacteriovorax antillogorgiicola]